jgi:hypothetical protein
MTEAVIYDLLNADSTYKDAIGSREDGSVKVFHTTADQTTQRPYAVYTVVSRTDDESKDEKGFKNYRIQLTHYAENAVQASQLDGYAEVVLDRYRGTVGSTVVSSIRRVGDLTDYSQGTESRYRSAEYSMKVQP